MVVLVVVVVVALVLAPEEEVEVLVGALVGACRECAFFQAILYPTL